MVLLAAAAHAACVPQSIADLRIALEGAESAWGVDAEGFTRSVGAADAILPCLAAVVDPPTAARLHRVRGLVAYANRDTAGATARFAASRSIEPDYVFPDAMVPPGNPVRAIYETATPSLASAVVAVPEKGRTYFDGAETFRRPTAAPTVFQLVEGDRAKTTDWLDVGEPLPKYRVRGAGTRVPLLIATGAAAAAGGVLYGLAVAERKTWDETTQFADETELNAQADLVNGLGYGAIGAGALAVGLGATAFIVGRW